MRDAAPWARPGTLACLQPVIDRVRLWPSNYLMNLVKWGRTYTYMARSVDMSSRIMSYAFIMLCSLWRIDVHIYLSTEILN